MIFIWTSQSIKFHCLNKMWAFKSLRFALLIPYGFAFFQNQYRVFQENMTVTDCDHKFVDMVTGVYPLNETTNALHVTVTFKLDLPRSSKIAATAFKLINGEYKLGILNIYKSLPSALEMEMFDLQNLFLNYCNPPIVWPFLNRVQHRCLGWSPDSTKFPAHLPAGQLKVPITIMLGNNTKMVVATWYLNLIYKK